MPTLFERVVETCGLSILLGPGVIRRACERAGIMAPEKMNRHELLRALPSIDEALHLYLAPMEARERAIAILQLTRAISSGFPIRLDRDDLDDED